MKPTPSASTGDPIPVTVREVGPFLYLDGQQAPLNYQAFYNTPNIDWRYVFLGHNELQGTRLEA